MFKYIQDNDFKDNIISTFQYDFLMGTDNNDIWPVTDFVAWIMKSPSWDCVNVETTDTTKPFGTVERNLQVLKQNKEDANVRKIEANDLINIYRENDNVMYVHLKENKTDVNKYNEDLYISLMITKGTNTLSVIRNKNMDSFANIRSIMERFFVIYNSWLSEEFLYSFIKEKSKQVDNGICLAYALHLVTLLNVAKEDEEFKELYNRHIAWMKDVPCDREFFKDLEKEIDNDIQIFCNSKEVKVEDYYKLVMNKLSL